jgi:hypothetical protein
MSKGMFKTSTLVGSLSGAATILIVVTIYIIHNWIGTVYAMALFVGNLIIYLPLGLLGGAIAGLVLGAMATFISRIISHGKAEPRISSVIGGVMGGILVGLAPVFIGFGYLY